MDWQQKAEALAALCELRIKFRERQWRIGGPEPWYVEQRVEVKDGSILCGQYGNGSTPEEANRKVAIGAIVPDDIENIVIHTQLVRHIQERPNWDHCAA